MMHRSLLSANNTKLDKSNSAGAPFFTVGLSLAPHNASGRNVCPMATLGCMLSCLYFAGRGTMGNVQRGRIRRTREFFADRAQFLGTLASDITYFRDAAARIGKRLAVRLNVLSDIGWERVAPKLFTQFPDVQFYDYTKIPQRILRGGLPGNYHLTFSRSEGNEDDCQRILKSKRANVAVVFRTKDLPREFYGAPVISGDETDLRFLDPRGVVVGLYAKGRAKKDATGFVVDLKGVN